MKKFITGAAVMTAALAALHHFGPAIAERGMKKCYDMIAQQGGCPMDKAT